MSGTSVTMRQALIVAVPVACTLILVVWLSQRKKSQTRGQTSSELGEAVKLRRSRYKAIADAAASTATIIESDDSLAAHWPAFESRVRQIGHCGLDCEWHWRTEYGETGQLALLQLATADGCALLIRVQQLTLVPPELEAFLADASVLKFGVGIDGDANKLAIDLGCSLSGWVDLRHLADRLPSDTVCQRRGLKSLASHLLTVDYSKLHWVARTDWELPGLTKHQVCYASLDAITGDMLADEMIALMPSSSGYGETSECGGDGLRRVCAPFVDLKYKTSERQAPSQLQQSALVDSKQLQKLQKFARRNPLYHNCQMLAPDGELMCTLDKRKADWYTERSLATVVSQEPVLIIRLNFEPSSRPRGDQAYYLSERENRCVVCASEHGLQRKKIVPDEFRHHFPELMKSHKSHDILLLCGRCHAVSERHTGNFKQQLIAEFGLDKPSNPEVTEQRAKSLAKALLSHARGKANIPEARRTEIASELLQLLSLSTTEDDVNCDEEADCESSATSLLTEDKLDAIIASAARTPSQQSSQLAGIIVQKSLDGGRLLELERRWRDHFLTTMQPRYLPAQWSVEHQHDLLRPRLEEFLNNDADADSTEAAAS